MIAPTDDELLEALVTHTYNEVRIMFDMSRSQLKNRVARLKKDDHIVSHIHVGKRDLLLERLRLYHGDRS